MIRLELTRDVAQFAERTRPLLSERTDCNVLATILLNVHDGRFADPPPLFAYGVDQSGTVVWAGLRTPPWPLIAGELDPAVAPELLALWLDADPQLPGVNAPPATARAIAAAWTSRTDRPARCRTRMAMHELEQVLDPPWPAPGRLRVATAEADRALLIEWWTAFVRDAGVFEPDVPTAVDARLGHGRMLIWDDDGPVSMVGVTPPVAGTVRIGPVYTPDARRRRGYAGTAVAAVSRRALADGARRCLLYTDLANPTSNKIYAEVGYRRISGWEEHEFLAP